MGVNHVSAWEVLHDQQLHSYYHQRVHAMGPADFVPRVDFCRWFLQRCVEEPRSPMFVLLSDEATFTREGIFNSRNSRVG
jgi:hypothetical protein